MKTRVFSLPTLFVLIVCFNVFSGNKIKAQRVPKKEHTLNQRIREKIEHLRNVTEKDKFDAFLANRIGAYLNAHKPSAYRAGSPLISLMAEEFSVNPQRIIRVFESDNALYRKFNQTNAKIMAIEAFKDSAKTNEYRLWFDETYKKIFGPLDIPRELESQPSWATLKFKIDKIDQHMHDSLSFQFTYEESLKVGIFFKTIKDEIYETSLPELRK